MHLTVKITGICVGDDDLDRALRLGVLLLIVSSMSSQSRVRSLHTSVCITLRTFFSRLSRHSVSKNARKHQQNTGNVRKHIIAARSLQKKKSSELVLTSFVRAFSVQVLETTTFTDYVSLSDVVEWEAEYDTLNTIHILVQVFRSLKFVTCTPLLIFSASICKAVLKPRLPQARSLLRSDFVDSECRGFRI